MNIFVLDSDPHLAAYYLCDKHVPKMLLETAQLLCNAIDGPTPYKKTHQKHPCTLWVQESLCNFHWLLDHGIELCNQFEVRFQKIHKSTSIIKWCHDHRIKHIGLQQGRYSSTPFALAMPDKYKCENAVDSYRNYYKGEKARFAKWDKINNTPWWWKDVA